MPGTSSARLPCGCHEGRASSAQLGRRPLELRDRSIPTGSRLSWQVSVELVRVPMGVQAQQWCVLSLLLDQPRGRFSASSLATQLPAGSHQVAVNYLRLTHFCLNQTGLVSVACDGEQD